MGLLPLLLLFLTPACSFSLSRHGSRSSSPSFIQLHCVRRVYTTTAGHLPRSRAMMTTMEVVDGSTKKKKKVVVVGAGWAGLGSAYELAKRSDEFDVTLLEVRRRCVVIPMMMMMVMVKWSFKARRGSLHNFFALSPSLIPDLQQIIPFPP